MKTNITIISLIALGASLSGVFSGCTAESPFAGEGTGAVKMHVVLDDKLSRAEVNDESLNESCNIYITTGEGYANVLHKWTGVGNIPASVALRYGAYRAEAYAGDSVPVSWDKKYYKGFQTFEVNSSQPNPEVQILCKIANVVVSVEKATIDESLIADDYSITFGIGDTNKTLVYGKAEVDNESKGYFMMPKNQTSLRYEVIANDKEGNSHKYSGSIADVQPAHEYRLKFKYGEGVSVEHGGAFIEIEIEKVAFEDDTIVIEGPPTIVGTEKQIVNLDGTFADEVVSVASYGALESLKLGLPAGTLSRAVAELDSVDLKKMTQTQIDALAFKGIELTEIEEKDTGVFVYHIYFRSKWLNSLPKSDAAIIVPIIAVDGKGNTIKSEFAIANTESGILVKDPIELFDIDETDWLAVTGTKATLSLRVVTPDAGTPVIRYCESGTADWQEAKGTLSGDVMTFNVTGLKTATKYEYQGCVGEFVSESKFFTTEAAFVIPNASFEDWNKYDSKVVIPWSVGDKSKSFWGSGNEGAATVGTTLTDKSSDMFNSGLYSARLESKSVFGMLAAGNIFVGEYVKTDGTNGVLSVGREYNGTHPAAMKVMANYRPGNKVSVKKGNEDFVPSGFAGGNDHGQIYVALTTAPVEIRTNPKTRKLFEKDGSEVLAYGQVTWESAFGPDGALQEVEIPLEYNDRAKTTKPTHLVIVVSASKYGDYFSGAAGSVMYLDDFELVY